MGTTAEKLSYLNETKTKIKNALETPYNVFRDYPAMIKKYIDNQPTKIVTNGICDNAVELPIVSLGADGNSYQESTTGKNKLPNDLESSTTSGITYTKNNDGSIKLSGIASARVEPKLYDGTGYTMPAGTYRNTTSYLIIGRTNTGYITFETNIAKELSSDTTFKQLYFRVENGDNVNETIYPQIILSSITDTSYEPYTGGIPSPSPDYPQEITNVGENGIKIKQSGNNLLNVPAEYTVLSTENNKEVPISLKANTTYTIKIGQINTDNTDVIGFLFRFRYNKADISNPYAYVYLSDLKAVYTPASDVDAVWIYSASGYNESANTNTTYKNLMIYEGIEDKSYEPYHEPKLIPINLNGNSIAKVGDVKDLLKIYRNGDVEIKKNIGKAILDGSEDENWKVFGKTFFADSINDYSAETFVPISNYFTGVSSKDGASSMTVDNTIAFANFRNPSRLYIKYDKMNTMDAFKTWLSQHPTEVYYQLATPQIITLPSISPIELWEGTNNFELITNLDTTFEMEYVVNKDYLETQNLLNAVEGENI